MFIVKKISAILLLSVSIASAEQTSVPFLETDFIFGDVRNTLVPQVIQFYNGKTGVWEDANRSISSVRDYIERGTAFNLFLKGFKQALNPFQWRQIADELLRRKELLEFIKSEKYEKELIQGKEPFAGFWKLAEQYDHVSAWEYCALFVKANSSYEKFKTHLAGFGTGAAVVSVTAVVVTALVAKAIYNKVKKSENKA